MTKTFLKKATILSVFEFQGDEKKLFGKFLLGFVIKDETNRFENNFRVITSSIDSQERSKYTTKSGNTYVVNAEAEKLDITFAEYVLMSDCLFSPDEILHMRQASQRNDERKLH
ncbi:hypothetical protein FGD67_21125 [Colwellia sp. M166]|uniref:hypothetical protein n=1 Tax=Colwellia sp. M166 TaxID=2583805 RepID=UPI00211F38FE|nr:hypothetical protein [Colwellia sp. M166]UUO25438.1 hypothetical protein FGD67_21125 [Colwellia sp. M166]